MGYRRRDDWWDLSDYLVHFTQRGALQSILASGSIEARRSFGCATNVSAVADSQRSACFSETPLGMLDRLVERYSMWGIGFLKATVIPSGAGRVWYLNESTPQRCAFQRLVTQAMSGGVDPNDDVWRITPFVDYIAPNYHFEWEREWRAPGGFKFHPADAAFLLLPEADHERVAAFLWDGGWDGGGPTGPEYRCPMIDPLWGRERAQVVLRAP